MKFEAYMSEGSLHFHSSISYSLVVAQKHNEHTCNNLSASALAIFGSLNDSWEIQKLKRKRKIQTHCKPITPTSYFFSGNSETNIEILVPEFWHLCTE